MITSVYPIPAFQANYIWSIEHGNACVLIDPGCSKSAQKHLANKQLNLLGILITHHHADHMGGVDALYAQYQPTIYGPKKLPINSPFIACHDGEILTCMNGKLNFEVIHTPGHTLDHLCYAGHGWLFCGDTLFSAGCGRLFEGTPAQMHQSLQNLSTLPDNTEVYCAHEYTLNNLHFAASIESQNPAIPKRLKHCQNLRKQQRPTLPSTIEEEKASNPFLRCHLASVQLALLADDLPKDPQERTLAAFTELRRLKDRF